MIANLTEKQQEIFDSNARIKLIMGGVRSGKTQLAILHIWEQMKKENKPHYKAIFLAINAIQIRHTISYMKNLIPTNQIIDIICHRDNLYGIKTNIGEIYVSDKLLDYPFDNITIDNATSSKYVTKELLNNKTNTYLTGHIPGDNNNIFFKLWLKEYFSKNSEIKSFLIDFCINVSDERKQSLINTLGLSRYNREYCGIPDFIDERYEKQLKKEYLADCIDLIEGNKIDFKLKKSYYFIGFDVDKE